MGLEETKKTIENFISKYNDSFMNYAKTGFIRSLVFCMNHLSQEKIKEVLNSYPEDFRQIIQKELDSISEFSEPVSNPEKRTENFILSQENLYTAEDYLALHNELAKLTNQEFISLITEYSNNKWLFQKLKILRPRLYLIDRLNHYEFLSLQKSLSNSDIYTIFRYAPENVVEFFKANISKNNLKNLEQEFEFMPEPTKEDYENLLIKTNAFLSDFYINGWDDI